jgi:hypothetical protein
MKTGFILLAMWIISVIVTIIVQEYLNRKRFNGDEGYTPMPSDKESIRDVPDKIYLQIGDEIPNSVNFKDLDEVTWCEDRINENDIEYVRVKKKNHKWHWYLGAPG